MGGAEFVLWILIIGAMLSIVAVQFLDDEDDNE